MITYNRLLEVLEYDKDTGIFTWAKSVNSRSTKGVIAGSVGTGGYIRIKIDNVAYSAHRLAWLYVYKENPKYGIDHINGNPADNRIINLRDIPQRLNTLNKKSHRNGHLAGVKKMRSRTNPWSAQIVIDGVKKHLGVYKTKEEAHNAYHEAIINIGGKG